nr:bifunctional riboflavin kinase/FAD synthetase [Parvularcula dongshanensis]
MRAPLACALSPENRGYVAVLGNLDGVHKGHQALLASAEGLAKAAGAPLAAVTFEPHPRRVFQPDAPPFLLTTLAQKSDILAALGCERVFALPFNEALRSLSPEAFVDEVLAGVLGLRGVVVGEDFRFGAKRAGDAALLAERGAAAGLLVETIGLRGEDAVKWSSTAARKALRDGDPEGAQAVMGRPFAVRGTVLEGRRLARELGFPTLNLELGDVVRPAYGAYAVTAAVDGAAYDGVANIGVRPTVDGQTERLEAHLFGFEGDLYGRTVEVALRAFLRPERPFDGVEALKAQIASDADAAKKALGEAR